MAWLKNGVVSLIVLASGFVVGVFGQQRWERTYGGQNDDYGYSVQQTSDGGYIVAGWSIDSGYEIQVYLIKTNAFGDTLWTRNYGGATTGERVYSIQQTTDGGYVIAGDIWPSSGNSQTYVIKTNASGDTVWTRTYGGAFRSAGRSVQQTTDGGYVIAGDIYPSSGNSQVYVIKTNASGDTLWTRNYGGSTTDDHGHSVQQTLDGGYIVAGIYDSEVWAQALLIKTDASGNAIWTKTYRGPRMTAAFSVQQTRDSGYIVAGGTGDEASYEPYVIKTNVSGDTMWTKAYGGWSDCVYCVDQTQDLGYILAGVKDYFSNDPQVYLIKTNSAGVRQWARTYGGIDAEESYSVQQTADGGFIVAGFTNSFGNGYQVYLIKTDANGSIGIEEEKAEARAKKIEVRIEPNPFVLFTTVAGHEKEQFTVYDIAGKRVGTYLGDRIGIGLNAGVYFIKSEDRGLKPVRIVKVR